MVFIGLLELVVLQIRSVASAFRNMCRFNSHNIILIAIMPIHMSKWNEISCINENRIFGSKLHFNKSKSKKI